VVLSRVRRLHTDWFRASTSKHVFVMPHEKVLIRAMQFILWDAEAGPLERVVASTVAVICTEARTHFEMQFWCYGHITSIEQSVQISSKQNPLKISCGPSFAYERMCTASSVGSECSPVTAQARA
jgi:hypothetical protein